MGDITNLNVEITQTREGVLKAYEEHCVGKVLIEVVPDDHFYFVRTEPARFNLFRLGHFSLSFYVSEPVKLAMEEARITGIEFYETKLFRINDDSAELQT